MPRFHLAALFLSLITALHGETIILPKIPGAAFGTPVAVDRIDAAAFTEWFDGKEVPIEPTEKQKNRITTAILCTTTTNPGNATLTFGDSKIPGPRHLRIGFKEPIPVGSVIAKNGGSLSVLKPGATYPGDLSDDSQWLPAQRYEQGAPVATQLDGKDLTLWILPPSTTTRALRFTHTAKVTDTEYRGEISGVVISPERFTNEASSATAGAGTNNPRANRIVNSTHDGWQAWENHEKGKSPENAPVISAEHPEFITLTWREPVALDGLVAIWAGIATADVQSFHGPADHNPKDAPDADWKSVATYEGIRHDYATQFWPNLLKFPAALKTRAIRLRITAAGANASHANNNGGKRAWLGELMAIRNLGKEPLKAAPVAAKDDLPTAPIPIRFKLDKPGHVSLVIEKPDGFRVRNLISETPFPVGENTVWWDGTDDLGRDADAADHGVYNIPVRYVEPGQYRIRGIVRDAIRPHFEFTVYTTGTPPWSTEDNTGAWLANHSPPQAAAFIPAAQSPTGTPVVYLGCYVTEGPSGLAWVDPATGKKLGGKKWIGGHWTAAPFLARDAGSKANPDAIVYVGSTWQTEKGSAIAELRITALTKSGDKDIIKHIIGDMEASEKAEDGAGVQLGGIAVHDGIIIAALTQKNKLLQISEATRQIVTSTDVEAPQGMTFDAKGNLLVLSGTKLLLYPQPKGISGSPTVLISSGLEDPKGITTAPNGSILISDWGKSHQVKIFSPEGKPIQTIGKPGIPSAGKYDPLRMNKPHGIAVDDRGQLWVTEHDYMPKRVSVWSAEGELVNAFYGPGKYGGGGALDPADKTKFYYADEGRGTLEFKLDWEKGTWALENVLHRRSEGDMKLAFRAGAPEHAIYYEDRRYFTNAYNSSPTGGHGTAYVFTERKGIVRPAAAMGNADRWDVLKTEPFKSRLPEGVDFSAKKDPETFFIWSDLNDDANVQPDEVVFHRAKSGGITVMSDLSFCAARVDGKSIQFKPTGFTESGVPLYDFSSSKVLATDVLNPKSSGGDQALAGKDGWSVVTLGIGGFDAMSISGAKDGVAKWCYPSPWPGLHASHKAPRPSLPGQLIGTTRLPGSFFEIPGFGPLWAIHTNHGSMAVFTQDGIFVANLFLDMRDGKSWKMPVAIRGMELDGLSLGEENFWPTLTHASDGKVYLVDGARSAIVRLDGFDSLKRLPDSDLTLTAGDIDKGRAWRTEAELARQKTAGTGIMKVAIRPDAPAIDGKLDEWSRADWVDIDKSGVKAYFNANTKPYDITGAVAVSGGKLFAAWKTGAETPLKNSGEMPLAPFKTGDALDLMLGPPGDRKSPVAGDMRLLVTLVKDKPVALLYRAVVPGTKDADKVPFSSPWRTIHFDKVEDVSDKIEFAGTEGNYEISIPLSALGIKPTPGAKIKGDIGILRGNGNETNARVYWNNKATGIISDVPEEAMLAPKLWGTLEFK